MSANDGGPAFPLAAVRDAPGGAMMSHFAEGMSLRDYFAGKALANALGGDMDHDYEIVARLCYEIADEMLKERSQ